jgi:cytidylate kinase
MAVRGIITVDGPAGSGKSTVARGLADRLGFAHLDTGAMYRALAVMTLVRDIDPARDPDAVRALAEREGVTVDLERTPHRYWVGDTEVTGRIREPAVTARVSDVAGIHGVRAVLVRAQQRLGKAHPRLVTEGRDQGTVVFPHAHAKFYLEASDEERARRRAHETGDDTRPVLDALRARDQRDVNREEGPLACPPEALRVDTTGLSVDQVLEELERLAWPRLAATKAPEAS